MPGKSIKRIYWDTCIFIDCLHQTFGRFQDIKPCLEEAEQEDSFLVTSTITQIEFYKLSHDPQNEDIEKINQFLDHSYIRRIPVDIPIALRAQKICNNFNIEFADSIHIATALETKAPFILTYDGIGKNNKTPMLEMDGKISLDNEKYLRILTPEQYNQIVQQEQKNARGMCLLDDIES